MTDSPSFFLNPCDIPALSSFLQMKDWLKSGERIQTVERAGESNMNCVLRVRTNGRSFILKQSRPWVEKYPHIAAPWDRALIEAHFYKKVKKSSTISPHLPELLEFDAAGRLLMFEDLGSTFGLSSFYEASENWMTEDDWRVSVRFLAVLHREFRNSALSGAFSNTAMRQLNHEHIFVLPLQRDNGLNLDAMTPGLARLAEQLQTNTNYVTAIASLGRLYLKEMIGNACLLHGDYFPGSWMKAGDSFYVIDPEFCFYGPAEWDMGVMLAHLYLAGQPAKLINSVPQWYAALAPLKEQLMRQFAGAEIMRRLIGVAQLPLRYGLDRKRELLQTSLDLVLDGSAS